MWLRGSVLLLLLANGAYFAWSQDYLADDGWAPVQQSEPQRLAQQIAPETLRIGAAANAPLAAAPTPPAAEPTAVPAPASASAPDTPGAPAAAPAPAANPPFPPPLAPSTAAPPVAAAAPAPAPAPASTPECLRTAPYDDKPFAALRQTAQAHLPAGSWRAEATVAPAHWIVYMGRYPDNETLARKQAELRALNVSFETLAAPPALAPGLSLGGFPTQAAAANILATLTQHGVRTARVLQDRYERRGQSLRFSTVTAALRAQLDALKPALGGLPLQPCSP